MQRHVGQRLDVVDRRSACRTARPRPGTAACCAARRACPRSTRTAPSPRRRCRRRRRAGARCRRRSPSRGCPARAGRRRAPGAIASASRASASRVLAAEVEVAGRAARGEGGDRHRLDDEERVALEQDAVLERAGLGFVGVADEVVRLGGLGGDRRPLAAGREGRAAATHQLRRRHLGDHGLRARSRTRGPAPGSRRGRDSRRARSGRRRRPGPAAGRGVPAARVTADHPGRSGAGSGREPPPAFQPRDDPRRVDRRDRERPARLAGDGQQGRRGAVAQAEARAPQPGRAAVAGRLAGRTERPLERRRTAPRRRPGGTRCRRRRGRRPVAAASSRTWRRTSPRRRPRPGRRPGACRCS